MSTILWPKALTPEQAYEGVRGQNPFAVDGGP